MMGSGSFSRRAWLTAGAALGLGAGFAAWRYREADVPDEAVRGLFSETFQGLDGQPRPMAAYQGKPLLLNFWATWCAPCIKELPDLERLGQKLNGQATVYLVNFGENTKTIEAFKAKKPELFGDHTVLLKDAKMSGLKAYGLRGVPTTVLINTSGEAVESIQGMKDWGADDIVSEIKAKILP